MQIDDQPPRRIRLDLMEPSEKLIQEAIWAIEKVGADVRLTNAQNLLNHAKDLVSDVIDEKLSPKKEKKYNIVPNNSLGFHAFLAGKRIAFVPNGLLTSIPSEIDLFALGMDFQQFKINHESKQL